MNQQNTYEKLIGLLNSNRVEYKLFGHREALIYAVFSAAHSTPNVEDVAGFNV